MPGWAVCWLGFTDGSRLLSLQPAVLLHQASLVSQNSVQPAAGHSGGIISHQRITKAPVSIGHRMLTHVVTDFLAVKRATCDLHSHLALSSFRVRLS